MSNDNGIFIPDLDLRGPDLRGDDRTAVHADQHDDAAGGGGIEQSGQDLHQPGRQNVHGNGGGNCAIA